MPAATASTKLVQTHVDPRLLRLLDTEARKQRRSRAAMLRIILDWWVDVHLSTPAPKP